MVILTLAQEPSAVPAVAKNPPPEPTLAKAVPNLASKTTLTLSEPKTTVVPTNFSLSSTTKPSSQFSYNGHLYLYQTATYGEYVNAQQTAMFRLKRCGRAGNLAIISTARESRAVAKYLSHWNRDVWVGNHMGDESNHTGGWPEAGKCPMYKNNLWTYGQCLVAISYLVEFNCPSISKCFDKAFKDADCSCGDPYCFVTAAKSLCEATYLKRGYTKPFYMAVNMYFNGRCSFD